jgi:hypothetical protein
MGWCRVVAVAGVMVVACVLGACKTTTTAGTPARFNGITGELTAEVGAPLERVFAAARASMDELGFRMTDQQKDALKATITAVQADGNRLFITLERRSDTVTRVLVDAGTLGQKSIAQAVLDQIESHL